MVKRYSDSGKSWWHEPPYTPEEEEALGEINAPPVSILRSTKEVSPQPPTQDKPDK